MASFFSSVRQGFGRQSNKSNAQARGNGQNLPSPISQGSGSPLSANLPPVPHSPGPNSAMQFETDPGAEQQAPQQRKPPFFFREEYSGLIVKGNFMTLAAKPVHVEEGEWLAHQVVEEYRLLDNMIKIVKTVNEKTGAPICNPNSCPTMSAAGHTYTWLDQQKRPIKIPACQYIMLVQKWIEGKFDDRNTFPTDNKEPSSGLSSGLSTPGAGTPIAAGPTNVSASLSSLAGKDWLGKSSGFPEHFESDLKSIFRQMMRCYAHLYHGHWLEPYWDLGCTQYLNTCFIHFINVGRTFGMLGDREMEPMLPLIQIWEAKGLLQPPQSQSSKMDISPVTAAPPPGTAS
ncbi:Mob1/phocein [Rhizodiscina lignyota]|uniref:Mob1/phocein n=1 Tax=Rhizodiscina lignyota TaxID=1504668 RepID=A0A9P4I141_9PEZI|nr:Mob1/phocein [Rhizodiscina lignyota]